MDVRVLSQSLVEVEADGLVVGVPTDARALPSRLAALDKRAGGQIKAVLGTVHHFLPTRSMRNPAGMIMAKTIIPDTVKSIPICVGAKFK